MKLLFSFFLFTTIVFSQKQFKVVQKNEDSILLKGSISGSPITLFLENKKIIDCDLYDNYIDGWYYYDKYKTKIYLTGYSKQHTLKLFNFGKEHFSIQKKLREHYTSISKIDSLYDNTKYEEKLTIDPSLTSAENNNIQKGVFDYKNKQSEIIIQSKNVFIGRQYDYFKLPNGTQIELTDIFSSYRGNAYYSLYEDKHENRVIFTFHSISNHNYCGMCGASNGEKGFRIIYFDKNWKIKNKAEYKTESCREHIYDTKMVKQNNNSYKYTITDSDEKVFHLSIDKSKSKITIKK